LARVAAGEGARIGRKPATTARLGAILVLALLAGCGGGPKTIQSRLIEFEVAQGANQDSPVAIDIVYVYDPQLVAQLTQMTARDWFQKKSQIRQAFPTGFDIASFEVVPGQKGPIEAVPSKSRQAIAAFVFANYASEGTHRARIDELEHSLIALGDKDFVVLPSKEAKQ
jgi:type VI secretion system protein